MKPLELKLSKVQGSELQEDKNKEESTEKITRVSAYPTLFLPPAYIPPQ